MFEAPVKVLLVEDERIIAQDLRMLLQSQGYDVVGIADNGKEALRLTRLHTPHIVFMDINIKGDLDGIQTVETIAESCETNFIYLTSSQDPVTLERAKETNPYKVLAKFRRNEILDTVSKFCAKHIE